MGPQCHVIAFSKDGKTFFCNMLLVPHLVDSGSHKPPRPESIGATLSPFHQDSQKNISHPLVHLVEIHYFPQNFGKNRVEQDPFSPFFPLLRSSQAGFHQILVTQPRRIAAISLARRVSCEQMDTKSRVVGRLGEQRLELLGT